MKAYELALRMGVRYIEIDILDGGLKDGQLVPKACNGTSTLEEVLETVKRNAFVKSEYPLFISLDVHCNQENERAAASLIKDTLGESLLNGPICKAENKLPSPEELKGKILLAAPVANEESNEEDVEEGAAATRCLRHATASDNLNVSVLKL